MKVKHFIFSFVAAAFLSSAISVDKKLEVGSKAPAIETIQGTNVVYDANSDKKETVVSFWSPKKPASRITNKSLYHKYGEENQENVEFISICIDSDENLMREVLKIDRMTQAKAYSFSEISSRVFKDYEVEENPRAFVISAQGKVKEII